MVYSGSDGQPGYLVLIEVFTCACVFRHCRLRGQVGKSVLLGSTTLSRFQFWDLEPATSWNLEFTCSKRVLGHVLLHVISLCQSKETLS